MTLKQLAINATIVIGTVAVAFLLWEFSNALFLFIFSLAIAASARPYVESLSNRGVSSAIAILVVYVLFITLLGVIFWTVGSRLLNELQRLSDSLAITYDQMWTTWPQGTQFQQLIIRQLPAPQDLFNGFSSGQESATITSLLGFTMSATTFLGEFFTVFVLSIYWSIDRVHFERLWLSLLPVKSRARSRDIWRAIERDFGEYVRSELLQSILAGVILGLGLWAMGIQYPILLAIFAALAWLIPWLGGVLAIIPVAIAGFSQSIGLGIFATVFALGVLLFLDFLIEPRFTRKRQFSSLLSILLIIALIEPFGLMGLIVAPPLAAAIELIFRYNLQSRPVPSVVKSEAQVTLLRARIVNLRQALANSANPSDPQTLSLISRLEDLIIRTDEAMEKEMLDPKLRNRVEA